MGNATQITVSTFGVLVGVAGIEHGIGEILQGNTVPSEAMILSWPDSPLFSMVNGEPAMTIIPNMLITGILAVLFSAIFIVWSFRFVQSKHGGLGLMFLSLAMFLFGGGLFPPVFGIILGIVATRINTPMSWWRAHLPLGLRLALGKWWAWSCGIGLIVWLLMFPGIPLLVYFFRMTDNPEYVFTLLVGMLGFFFSTIIAGLVRDMGTQPNATSDYEIQRKAESANVTR